MKRKPHVIYISDTAAVVVPLCSTYKAVSKNLETVAQIPSREQAQHDFTARRMDGRTDRRADGCVSGWKS